MRSLWTIALATLLALPGQAQDTEPSYPDAMPAIFRWTGEYGDGGVVTALVRATGEQEVRIELQTGTGPDSCRDFFGLLVGPDGGTTRDGAISLAPAGLDLRKPTRCMPTPAMLHRRRPINGWAELRSFCSDAARNPLLPANPPLGPGVAILDGAGLAGASLKDIDLRGAIICKGDFSQADVSGARLDLAQFGPGVTLAGAVLRGASLRGAVLDDVPIDGADFSGADLRGTRFQFGGEEPSFAAEAVSLPEPRPAMVEGADLRGAHLPSVSMVVGKPAGVDGLFLAAAPDVPAWLLAAGLKPGESVFLTGGRSERPVAFTQAEIAELAAAPAPERVQQRPAFDCAKAASRTEEAICAVADLATMDRALDWLWSKTPRGPETMAAQRDWLKRRNACGPRSDCIADAYRDRVRELAARLPDTALPSEAGATYRGLSPWDAGSPAMSRFTKLLGGDEDYLTIRRWLPGGADVDGFSRGARDHFCDFQGEAATSAVNARQGALIVLSPPGTSGEDGEGVGLVVTPDILITIGDSQFGCGTNARWQDVYFRWP